MRILQDHGTLRLTLVIFGNALQRVAAGTSGVLVGLYLADLANHRFPIGAALVCTLGAVSFAAELIGAVPMGIASDALVAAAATLGDTGLYYWSVRSDER